MPRIWRKCPKSENACTHGMHAWTFCTLHMFRLQSGFKVSALCRKRGAGSISNPSCSHEMSSRQVRRRSLFTSIADIDHHENQIHIVIPGKFTTLNDGSCAGNFRVLQTNCPDRGICTWKHINKYARVLCAVTALEHVDQIRISHRLQITGCDVPAACRTSLSKEKIEKFLFFFSHNKISSLSIQNKIRQVLGGSQRNDLPSFSCSCSSICTQKNKQISQRRYENQSFPVVQNFACAKSKDDFAAAKMMWTSFYLTIGSSPIHSKQKCVHPYEGVKSRLTLHGGRIHQLNTLRNPACLALFAESHTHNALIFACLQTHLVRDIFSDSRLQSDNCWTVRTWMIRCLCWTRTLFYRCAS